MIMILGLLGALQMFFGFAVYLIAKGAIHEITGAVSFGSGVIAVGLAQLCLEARRAEADRADIEERLGRMEKLLGHLPPARKQLDDFVARLAARKD